MNQTLAIGCLVVILFISILISRKDFKNWSELSDTDKMYTLRPIIGITVIIVILLYSLSKK